MNIVLAVDIGGSSLRTALVDGEGTILAIEATSDVPLVDQGDQSEIDPEHWWQAFARTSAALAARLPRAFSGIAVISVCGLTRTQVFLDGRGIAPRPAMSWKDGRAQAGDGDLPPDFAHPEIPNLGPYHPASRLAWVRRHEPEIFGRIAVVIEPKDYLNFRLTGTVSSDPISQARLAASAEPRNGVSLLDRLSISRRILPPWRLPAEVAGVVSAGHLPPFDRLAGTPVAVGCHDTYAAVLGLGALRPGYAYNISGTTEVLGLFSERPAEADGLVSVDWGICHQLGGPSQNGADVLRWLLPTLGIDVSTPEAVEKALNETGGGGGDAAPLLFLPFLQGERVPYWDPDLRGAFIGLNRHHTAGNLIQAALEGIAFQNRDVLERAESAFAMTATGIRFGGGGARSARWAAIKADVLRRPVSVGAAEEPGVIGAAILGLTAIGVFPTLEEAQQVLAKVSRAHQPNPDRAAFYDRLYDAYMNAQAAVRPLSHTLARMFRKQ